MGKFREPPHKSRTLGFTPTFTREYILDEISSLCQDCLFLIETDLLENIVESIYAHGEPKKSKEVAESIRYLSGADEDALVGMLEGIRETDILIEEFVEKPEDFVEIAVAAGASSHRAFSALGKPGIKELFAAHREDFVKIAVAAGMSSEEAFLAIGKPGIREMFAKNPKEVTKSFVEIAVAADVSSYNVFSALGKPGIKELFVAHREDFVEIAMAAGMSSGEAFLALGKPGIREMFAENPKEVTRSFVEIAVSAGVSSGEVFLALGKPGIRELFIAHREDFVEIAVAADLFSDDAFRALGKPGIKELFIAHKADFVKIANAAGMSSGEAFLALGKPGIKELFIAHREDFVKIANAARNNTTHCFETLEIPETRRALLEIAKAVGENAGDAFGFLADPKIKELFLTHKEEFVEIAKIAGKNSGDIFAILGKPGIRKLFSREPKNIIQLTSRLVSICGRRAPWAFKMMNTGFGIWALKEDPAILIKLAEASAYSFSLDPSILGYMEPTLKKMAGSPQKITALFKTPPYGRKTLVEYESAWKTVQGFVKSLGAHADDREICINFAYALDVIGRAKTKEIYNRFGIEYFARYSKESLEEAYLESKTSKHWRKWRSNKPLIVIANGKADNRKAFYKDAKNVDFLRKYYDVVVMEVETEGQLYRRLSEVSRRHGKIDTLIIGGHGSSASITLGIGEEEQYGLDTSDWAEMRKYRKFFEKTPTIILESCSTGKDKRGIGDAISHSWGAKLFAPEEPTLGGKYVIDPSTGKISDVKWGRVKGAIFVRGEKQGK